MDFNLLFCESNFIDFIFVDPIQLNYFNFKSIILMLEPLIGWSVFVAVSWILFWWLKRQENSNPKKPKPNWDLFVMLDLFDRRYRALQRRKRERENRSK